MWTCPQGQWPWVEGSGARTLLQVLTSAASDDDGGQHRGAATQGVRRKEKPGWNWGPLALTRSGRVAMKEPEGRREVRQEVADKRSLVWKRETETV